MKIVEEKTSHPPVTLPPLTSFITIVQQQNEFRENVACDNWWHKVNKQIRSDLTLWGKKISTFSVDKNLKDKLIGNLCDKHTSPNGEPVWLQGREIMERVPVGFSSFHRKTGLNPLPTPLCADIHGDRQICICSSLSGCAAIQMQSLLRAEIHCGQKINCHVGKLLLCDYQRRVKQGVILERERTRCA